MVPPAAAQRILISASQRDPQALHVFGRARASPVSGSNDALGHRHLRAQLERMASVLESNFNSP